MLLRRFDDFVRLNDGYSIELRI